MYRECCFCGKAKDYTAKEAKGSSKEALHFCSVVCIRQYITSQIFSKASTQEILRANSIPMCPRRGDVYSMKLGGYYRSRYEVDVAKVGRLRWGVDMRYEPHGIEVTIRSGKTVVYCPDFFIPSSGVWVEVKGIWSGEAKQKFEAALSVLGRDRMVLIPYMHQKEFAAIAGRI